MDQILYLAFRKKAGGLFSRIIRWRTNGQYSHVELMFFWSHRVDVIGAREPRGVEHDEHPADWQPDPAEWDLVPVVCPGRVSHVFAAAMREVGKPYDFRSILRFFVGWGRDASTDRWFCSEFCTAALQSVGLFTELRAVTISPQDLWIAAVSREDDHNGDF